MSYVLMVDDLKDGDLRRRVDDALLGRIPEPRSTEIPDEMTTATPLVPSVPRRQDGKVDMDALRESWGNQVGAETGVAAMADITRMARR